MLNGPSSFASIRGLSEPDIQARLKTYLGIVEVAKRVFYAHFATKSK